MSSIDQYRGQWGGKIASGEEMWWSEPNAKLQQSLWSRLRFLIDVRHYFILRFWRLLTRRMPPEKRAKLNVIDFGCGTGGTTLNFSNQFGVPITGVDVFETQLGVAREFAKKLGSSCSFSRLDPEGQIPARAGSVDAVLSIDVLGHVPDILAVLKEWNRVLKQGGGVLLFTESTYSPADRSLMAYFAASGADMMKAVPEHISLLPREDLEVLFTRAGFEVIERYSANIWHFFFFPKDYISLLNGHPSLSAWRTLAIIWNRLTKLTPFYPRPLEFLRLLLTRVFGTKAHGTSYFYFLRKRNPTQR